MTHKLYIIVYFICFFAFFRQIQRIFLRPLTLVAHPGARTWCHAFAVVGVVLLAMLTDRSSRKQKYLDYDVVPADGVEPPQGHAGRGME